LWQLSECRQLGEGMKSMKHTSASFFKLFELIMTQYTLSAKLIHFLHPMLRRKHSGGKEKPPKRKAPSHVESESLEKAVFGHSSLREVLGEREVNLII
jgi:hypothetical protein